MKLKIFFLTILITVGLAVYGYYKAIPEVDTQTGEYPRIEAIPESFDFGEIEYGEIAEHTFRVKNSGGEVLEIKKVSTSCACTSAEISKERIFPQEKAELKVTYNTGAMSGPHAKGAQDRIIYVRSNDPLNPQVEIMIKALVN